MTTDHQHILERRVERESMAYAESRGWWEVKIKVASKNGVPDRLLVRNGRVIFIEFKRPGELPRPQQIRRINELRAHNVEVFVVDNVADAKVILK